MEFLAKNKTKKQLCSYCQIQDEQNCPKKVVTLTEFMNKRLKLLKKGVTKV